MLKVANSVIDASRITGVLPVVNGGTGVTTSTGTGNTVLSAAPTLSSNVTLSTGNLVIGTAGKGIDFSITSHPAGMTSELLADYEEGTWTPGQGTQTVVGAYASSGTYTKIGRQVTVRGTATGATTIAGATATYFDNLPFEPANDFPGGTGTNDNGTFARWFGLSAGPSGRLYILGGYGAVTGVYFSCTYFV